MLLFRTSLYQVTLIVRSICPLVYSVLSSIIFLALQPDLAEGEEVINQDIIGLKEGLYEQVVCQNFFLELLNMCIFSEILCVNILFFYVTFIPPPPPLSSFHINFL